MLLVDVDVVLLLDVVELLLVDVDDVLLVDVVEVLLVDVDDVLLVDVDVVVMFLLIVEMPNNIAARPIKISIIRGINKIEPYFEQTHKDFEIKRL